MLGPVVELLEIVRSVIEVGSPVEAEPAHVSFDGIDIFLLLLRRVRVIEAQMTAAAEFLRHAEVKADRLGVTDVQVPVGLRREARHHTRVTVRGEVSCDDIADEVAPPLCHRGWSFRHVASTLFSKPRSMCQIRERAPSRLTRKTFDDLW